MGLLHDIGKQSREFQDYIRRAPGTPGRKGPDHATAGAKAAIARYGSKMGRVLAYGIAGHHAGLANGSDIGGPVSTLSERLNKQLSDYSGWENHAANLPAKEDMKGVTPPTANSVYPGFEFFLLTRMLYSCLVDADFLATEIFYSRMRKEGMAGGRPVVRGGEIGPHHLARLKAHQARQRNTDSPVNRLRAQVLSHAVEKARLPPGLFTLTVPTGGGKTLTSLRFALEHALHHGKKRIIYVIPFTSIIEQTADVFRSALEAPDDILEHHSNFDWENGRPKEGGGNAEAEQTSTALAKLRRDAENWDAPIIVTTAVQFFESLFARQTSRCRKLHRIADSVVILDEAQSLPVPLLRPCMAVLDELAKNYRTTVVLCTATQPALRRMDKALPLPDNKSHPPEGFDICDKRELAPDPKTLYTALKRVNVERLPEPVEDEAIITRFAEQKQMLCIVGTRSHARELHEAMMKRSLAGSYHLTTLMYPRHRRRVLDEIRLRLKDGLPVRLVATSLIEAGVDIDFPEVWRAAAGLDSIAQAAGRCNREGKLDSLGRTVVFEPAGRKVLQMDGWQAGRTALSSALENGNDLLGLEAVHCYFQEFYFKKGYPALDVARLGGAAFPILPAIRETREALNFPFASISEAFRMIDNAMEPVIIPADDEARALVASLEHADTPPGKAMRGLQQYTVNVPGTARGAILASGALQAIRPDQHGERFLKLVSMSLYDESTGLKLDDPTFRSAEANIFP